MERERKEVERESRGKERERNAVERRKERERGRKLKRKLEILYHLYIQYWPLLIQNSLVQYSNCLHLTLSIN